MAREAAPAEIIPGQPSADWTQSYGERNKDCLEWTDTCVNCVRSQQGENFSCSKTTKPSDGSGSAHNQCPLYPQKRTSTERDPMSALCHLRKVSHAASWLTAHPGDRSRCIPDSFITRPSSGASHRCVLTIRIIWRRSIRNPAPAGSY